MSETAVKALLEQPDTKTRRGVRDQFFMILMYDSMPHAYRKCWICGSVIYVLGTRPTAVLEREKVPKYAVSADAGNHGMALSLISSSGLGIPISKPPLVYAYADTEQKRRAIEKSMGRDVIAGVDLPKYSVSDEEVLKKLYGLK